MRCASRLSTRFEKILNDLYGEERTNIYQSYGLTFSYTVELQHVQQDDKTRKRKFVRTLSIHLSNFGYSDLVRSPTDFKKAFRTLLVRLGNTFPLVSVQGQYVICPTIPVTQMALTTKYNKLARATSSRITVSGYGPTAIIKPKDRPDPPEIQNILDSWLQESVPPHVSTTVFQYTRSTRFEDNAYYEAFTEFTRGVAPDTPEPPAYSILYALAMHILDHAPLRENNGQVKELVNVAFPDISMRGLINMKGTRAGIGPMPFEPAPNRGFKKDEVFPLAIRELGADINIARRGGVVQGRVGAVALKVEPIKKDKRPRNIWGQAFSGFVLDKALLAPAVEMGSGTMGTNVALGLQWVDGGAQRIYEHLGKPERVATSDFKSWEVNVNIACKIYTWFAIVGTYSSVPKDRVTFQMLSSALADWVCPITLLDATGNCVVFLKGQMGSGFWITFSGNSYGQIFMIRLTVITVSLHQNKQCTGCRICKALEPYLEEAVLSPFFVGGDDHISAFNESMAQCFKIVSEYYGMKLEKEMKNFLGDHDEFGVADPDSAEFFRMHFKKTEVGGVDQVVPYRDATRVLAKLYHGSRKRDHGMLIQACDSMLMQNGFNEPLFNMVANLRERTVNDAAARGINFLPSYQIANAEQAEHGAKVYVPGDFDPRMTPPIERCQLMLLRTSDRANMDKLDKLSYDKYHMNLRLLSLMHRQRAYTEAQLKEREMQFLIDNLRGTRP